MLHFLPNEIWNIWCDINHIYDPVEFKKIDKQEYNINNLISYSLDMDKAILVFDSLVAETEIDDRYIEKWMDSDICYQEQSNNNNYSNNNNSNDNNNNHNDNNKNNHINNNNNDNYNINNNNNNYRNNNTNNNNNNNNNDNYNNNN